MASTSKAWGQNFLKSRKLAAALVADSGIDRDDEVYEIGSGKGIITRELARRAGKVVAVERDPDLAARLKRRFDGEERVEIRCADFLDIPLRKARYKIFGNIPFNITTAVIDKITSATRPPQDTWLLVQKEAGRRFAGRPRTTLFSALAGPFFELSLGRMVRRTEFDPRPEVDAVLLRIKRREKPLVAARHADWYRKFVRWGFEVPQRDLKRTYKHLFTYVQWRRLAHELGFPLRPEPADLNIDQWLGLFDFLSRDRALRRFFR